MPREFPRSRRVEEAIQRILSEALSSKARDPRLAGVMVTDVSVSRDLSVGKVFYTLLSGEPASRELGQALHTAAGFLRSALARDLRVRHVPELRFFPDEALARGRVLANLIDKAVAGDRDADPGKETSGEGSL